MRIARAGDESYMHAALTELRLHALVMIAYSAKISALIYTFLKSFKLDSQLL